MKRYLLLLSALVLLFCAKPVYSQTNGVLTLNVTSSPINITTDTVADHVVVREDSSSPTAAFVITIAGTNTSLTYAAGSTFTFVAQNGAPWKSGTVIGTIATVTGSATFKGIESIGPPSTQAFTSTGSSSSSSGGACSGPGCIAATTYGVKADAHWVQDATVTNASGVVTCLSGECNFTTTAAVGQRSDFTTPAPMSR
jgi:hypothetical protein